MKFEQRGAALGKILIALAILVIAVLAYSRFSGGICRSGLW